MFLSMNSSERKPVSRGLWSAYSKGEITYNELHYKLAQEVQRHADEDNSPVPYPKLGPVLYRYVIQCSQSIDTGINANCYSDLLRWAKLFHEVRLENERRKQVLWSAYEKLSGKESTEVLDHVLRAHSEVIQPPKEVMEKIHHVLKWKPKIDTPMQSLDVVLEKFEG